MKHVTGIHQAFIRQVEGEPVVRAIDRLPDNRPDRGPKPAGIEQRVGDDGVMKFWREHVLVTEGGSRPANERVLGNVCQIPRGRDVAGRIDPDEV